MYRQKTVPIDDDFQEMLVSAERYALGRMTYIVSLTVDLLEGKTINPREKE